MELAATARACGMMTPTRSTTGTSAVNDILVISVGAILGANARWLVSTYLARMLGPIFPYGTLLINIVGSFVVGFFMVWTTERVVIDSRWRLLVVVGFCGSFTTFSSFAFETMVYLKQGQWALMFTNFLANNLLCLGAALAGMALGQAM